LGVCFTRGWTGHVRGGLSISTLGKQAFYCYDFSRVTTFINPFTDFGFKKIFGEEASKPHLIDFLNSLLPAFAQIKDLSFKNLEQLPSIENERKAVYDIYCQGANGEYFIVELQKLKQDFFKDRTLFYATFPIQQQAQKGNWNYKLAPVYCIAILDFKYLYVEKYHNTFFAKRSVDTLETYRVLLINF
jgi:predicted transposase/invertase (TIGR01784 family)